MEQNTIEKMKEVIEKKHAYYIELCGAGKMSNSYVEIAVERLHGMMELLGSVTGKHWRIGDNGKIEEY